MVLCFGTLFKNYDTSYFNLDHVSVSDTYRIQYFNDNYQ